MGQDARLSRASGGTKAVPSEYWRRSARRSFSQSACNLRWVLHAASVRVRGAGT